MFFYLFNGKHCIFTVWYPPHKSRRRWGMKIIPCFFNKFTCWYTFRHFDDFLYSNNVSQTIANNLINHSTLIKEDEDLTIKIYYSISFFPVSEETRGKLFPQLQISFFLACSPPACIFIIISCVFTRTHYYQHHHHPTIHMIIIIVYPILGQGLFFFFSSL